MDSTVQRLVEEKAELRRAIWQAHVEIREKQKQLGKIDDQLERVCKHVWVRQGYDGGHGEKVCEICGIYQ